VSGPRAAYEARLAARQQTHDAAARRERAISNGRLAVFAAGLVVAVLTSATDVVPWTWVLVPGALFVGLVLVHDRVIRAKEQAARAVLLYQTSLARLDDDFAGKGTGGARFSDPRHLYAADLDLFGEGSLFELLCRARTSFGEETLAAWLRAPAPPAVVARRQGAVAHLREAVGLREDVALLGDDVRAKVEPELLLRWAAGRCEVPAFAAPLALALVGATLVATGLWATGLAPGWAVLVLLTLEGLFALALKARTGDALAGGSLVARELSVLALLLARLEEERFDEPHLGALLEALKSEGLSPSAQIKRLAGQVNRLEWAQNQFFLPLAMALLWRTQHAVALERWRRQVGPKLPLWLSAVGELEALLSLASHAFERPDDVFPALVEGHPRFEGEGLGHPLLAGGGVRNDVAFGEPVRLLLVSGSNMSGKSTFLRTVGINVVLAQAGSVVRARRLTLSPFQVGATLRIQDSLAEGASRFYAEITRLKQLKDAAGEPVPLLFLVDELLSGTNSHDRRIGAEAFLQALVKAGAAGLATTHDLALAAIAERLSERARNVHFEDHLEGKRVLFDYQLREGVVARSNALALMRAVGLLEEPPAQ
jgi:hypothetical protein